jgi:hypothetical protein
LRSRGSHRQQRSRSRRRWPWRRPRPRWSLRRRPCRRPPSPTAHRQWWWRSRTTTFHRRAGISGQAQPHQPPRPRRGTRGQGWCRRSAGTPTDGAGASSSRIGPSARPEQEQEHVEPPPTHFVDAQAEQGLWQELHDHGASLNHALNEALRIHSGPAWRVFQVSRVSQSFLPFYFAFVLFLTPALVALLVGGRRWSAGLGRGRTPSTVSMPTFTGTGGSMRPWTPSSRP